MAENYKTLARTQYYHKLFYGPHNIVLLQEGYPNIRK